MTGMREGAFFGGGPDSTGNAAGNIARAAGYGRGAEVTASKWLRLAEVRTYIRAVTETADAELGPRRQRVQLA